ncbi:MULTISPECIES: PadR family transcriptional regulator [Thalassospira]|uniref:PadR family transcriptional regulator n=2 Tax=Thalassospira TaxID=168934 RepID=A0A367WBV7_9PROT|nr:MULTISPECIES: PadR family transcriptional regulator [Thalassospira]MDG4718190.1 PadR family transcriptional regulator [Thalassospira sp. FZY0004]RCK37950.1 PadR family transcriptional regulator [Thalassospira profundimaris]
MDVRTLCLGALMGGEATGYEIRKMFEDGTFSHFQIASLGSIYPALTKLTQDGLVTFVEHEQENRPDKKVYQLTSEGRRTFLRTLLQTRPAEDRYRSDILFMLTFAEEMPIELTEALIDEFAARHELMNQQIDPENEDKPGVIATYGRDDDGAPRPGCCFVAGLGQAMCEATLKFIRENKQGLLDDLRKFKSRKD